MPSNPFSILVADDDPEDLELLQDAFRSVKPDADLVQKHNGRQLMEYLDSCSDQDLPCLIILDYNMPEMNGAQVLARICTQARYQDIPKLVLSTSASRAHIRECLDNGAIDYFVKPASMQELKVLAQQMLDFCSPN